MRTQGPSALCEWEGPFGLPDFTAFADADFEPAFDAALAAHEREIEAIAADGRAASVDNTLKALELSGRALDRLSSVFWLRAGAETNEAIRALERRIAPRMARHHSNISMEPRLFARIDSLHRRRGQLGLDPETDRVLDKVWKGFVRNGAKLDAAGKARLAEINEELAGLGARFGQNVLKDESDWALFLGEKDLSGLPDDLRHAMRAAAAERGQADAFVVTLSRSIVEPFLTFSDRRDLREAAFRAWTARGDNGGGTDNGGVVAETLALRAEKARLLGYETYAAYKLDDTMAKTPGAVMGLLEPVWDKALRRAALEEADLQRLAAAGGLNHPIAPWDWRYYAEKLRAERFAFDDKELKPYLRLETMVEAAFAVANRLFGLRFEEKTGVALWHPDVRLFEVTNADGTYRGLFLADYFARSTKRSGAWMSALGSAHKLEGGETPVIYNVMNFARPPKGEPALLSLDEARTLFHEFGHALHGLLTEAAWPSLAGTNVARDFVELPSQLYEHWLTVPEVLSAHAVHYRTGEPMPTALLDKVLAAQTFNAGFATVEFAASALVDMAFHARPDAPADPGRFEAETLERLNMPASITMRHRTPHFQHVFSGDGYSAGYYSYLWSEVLDADAFAAFDETGNPFDPETAAKLTRHIYSAGDTADPEALYTAFRGRMPTPDAMLKGRGLA